MTCPSNFSPIKENIGVMKHDKKGYHCFTTSAKNIQHKLDNPIGAIGTI
jgi:hypothetical protein